MKTHFPEIYKYILEVIHENINSNTKKISSKTGKDALPAMHKKNLLPVIHEIRYSPMHKNFSNTLLQEKYFQQYIIVKK